MAYNAKGEYTGEYAPKAEEVQCQAECGPYDAGPHGPPLDLLDN